MGMIDKIILDLVERIDCEVEQKALKYIKNELALVGEL